MKYIFENRTNNVAISVSKNLDCELHLHEHIEAGYIISGSSEIYIERERYELEKGDVFIVFPNQIHAYENSNKVESDLMIFSTEVVPEFRKVLSHKIPTSPVIKNSDSVMTELFSVIRNENRSGMLPETAKGLMQVFVGMCIERLNLEDINKYNISTLKNALIYCNEHYTETVNAAQVAKDLNISRSHLAHMFKERLGETFGHYIARKRIELACELLEQGEHNVMETSIATGFNSVRTFNRAFVNIMGISPAEYKKSNANIK